MRAKIGVQAEMRAFATAIAAGDAHIFRVVVLAACQEAVKRVKAAIPWQARVAIETSVPFADGVGGVAERLEGIAKGAKSGWQAHPRPDLEHAVLQARVDLVASAEQRGACWAADVLHICRYP